MAFLAIVIAIACGGDPPDREIQQAQEAIDAGLVPNHAGDQDKADKRRGSNLDSNSNLEFAHKPQVRRGWSDELLGKLL